MQLTAYLPVFVITIATLPHSSEPFVDPGIQLQQPVSFYPLEQWKSGWYPGYYNNYHGNTNRKRCPLCDSSVYSYCSEKLFHDSCCCYDPNNPYAVSQLPYQCQYADCSFLHANTCAEHKLITACCCIS